MMHKTNEYKTISQIATLFNTSTSVARTIIKTAGMSYKSSLGSTCRLYNEHEFEGAWRKYLDLMQSNQQAAQVQRNRNRQFTKGLRSSLHALFGKWE